MRYPIGGGFRSVNVTLRQNLDLYANVRPVKSIPGVEPRFDVDITIVRENTEGLYAGLELMILPGIAQSLKLTTAHCSNESPSSRSTTRRNTGALGSAWRQANIMKVSGLALETTREVAQNFPDIELREIIIDAAAMTMVRDPNGLDVLVTENLYGDVLSDLGAGLVGGLGFVPGANIGVLPPSRGRSWHSTGHCWQVSPARPLSFERHHDAEHLGENAAAQRIERALYQVYQERKVLTGDAGGTASTREFTDELCRLIETTD